MQRALVGSVALLCLASAPCAAKPPSSCTPWSVQEAFAAPSLIFKGTPAEIDPSGIVRFKAIFPLKGIELSKANVRYPSDRRPEIGAPVLVAAFGTFETGYSTTTCLIEQYSPKSPSFENLQSEIFKFRSGFEERSRQMGENLTFLLPIRDTANYALDNKAGEVAARLYLLATTISKDEEIDVLKQGRALLLINSNKLALSRFDDILEKDGQNQAAWQGRYLALAQMNRWSELPFPRPSLTGLTLLDLILPKKLNLEGTDLRQGMWRNIKADGIQAKGANFSGSMIVESRFSGSDFRGADFRGAYLRDVDFRGSRLEGALFEGSELVGVRR